MAKGRRAWAFRGGKVGALWGGRPHGEGPCGQKAPLHPGRAAQRELRGTGRWAFGSPSGIKSQPALRLVAPLWPRRPESS